jgi:hypothetical protein
LSWREPGKPGARGVGYLLPSSSPDLIRRSIFLRKKMDARVKPGHDEKEKTYAV